MFICRLLLFWTWRLITIKFLTDARLFSHTSIHPCKSTSEKRKNFFASYSRPGGQILIHLNLDSLTHLHLFIHARIRTLLRIIIDIVIMCILLYMKEGMENLANSNKMLTKTETHAYTPRCEVIQAGRVCLCLLYNCGWNIQYMLFISQPGRSFSVLFRFVLILMKIPLNV